MTLTAKDVAEITRLLEESAFDELHLEMEGLKLMLRRAGAPAATRPDGGVTGNPVAGTGAGPGNDPAASRAAPTAPGKPPPTAARDTAGSRDAGPSRDSAVARDPAVQDVPAPLLGTFYRSPKPGSPPFVEVGSTVEEDTIIGIIEVMKLMNTVRAGARGQVTEILARDGVLVEYGETLLRVRRASPA